MVNNDFVIFRGIKVSITSLCKKYKKEENHKKKILNDHRFYAVKRKHNYNFIKIESFLFFKKVFKCL